MNRNLILSLFFYLSFSFILPGQNLKHDMRLTALREEVSNNLTLNLLPFWIDKMTDHRNGGFYGRIDVNNKVYPKEDKGGILNARILWTFSSAYRVTGDTSYLRIAKRSENYIMEHFIDKKSRGAFRSVRANGEPSDTRKQTYTQAFFIYGLSEYYRATGDGKALEAAKDIYNLFEKYALDRVNNGYFEVFARDWTRVHDRLIGESSEMEEKTMNTQLHIMEAYANLYRVWPDQKLGDRLKTMVNLFLDRITDPVTGHLICFMDRAWKPESETDSYGHDIESSWLLYEAAGLLKDRQLLEKVRVKCIKIAEAARDGLQSDGSMIYEKDKSSGKMNTERSWWAEAETVVGYFNAWELTGNDKYFETSLRCWNYIKSHLVDDKSGGWFSSATESGSPGNGDKGGFWVCPYHNGRMCMEIMERISKLNN